MNRRPRQPIVLTQRGEDALVLLTAIALAAFGVALGWAVFLL